MPRDSGEAEQVLFDQIDDSIDRARTGQKLSVSVRSTHWYQDLVLAPTDLDTLCAPLCRLAADEIRKLLAGLNEPEPPRAVWLTHDAGRLPREVSGNLDRRLRAVEERVRAAMDSAWRRTTPDDNPLLAQMREQVAEAEARLERAQASGDVRRIRVAQQSLDVKRKFLELAERGG